MRQAGLRRCWGGEFDYDRCVARKSPEYRQWRKSRGMERISKFWRRNGKGREKRLKSWRRGKIKELRLYIRIILVAGKPSLRAGPKGTTGRDWLSCIARGIRGPIISDDNHLFNQKYIHLFLTWFSLRYGKFILQVQHTKRPGAMVKSFPTVGNVGNTETENTAQGPSHC